MTGPTKEGGKSGLIVNYLGCEGKRGPKEDLAAWGELCCSVKLSDPPCHLPERWTWSILVTAQHPQVLNNCLLSAMPCPPSVLACLSLLVFSSLLTSPLPAQPSCPSSCPLQLRGSREWADAITRPQPPGLAGKPRPGAACWGGHQPAPRVLPLPLGQRLRHVPQDYVPELIGHQRSVSTPLLTCLLLQPGPKLPVPARSVGAHLTLPSPPTSYPPQ